MKTTLKEKLNTTSAAIQTQGQKAFKHPITSILSLCLVAGIAATIAGFSQAPTETNEFPTPAAAVSPKAGTLPTARTLTSTDGRTIDVTILSKSATTITAARTDGKSFEIALDKLSEADRAFVAELVEAPVKKPSILFLVDRTVDADDGLIFVEDLIRQGFDVTFGLNWPYKIKPDHEVPRGFGDLLGAKCVFILNPSDADKYSVVWVTQPAQIYNSKEGFEMFKHRNSKELRVVTSYGKSWLKYKDYLLTGTGGPEKKEPTEDEPNYCEIQGKWMFYWDRKVGPSQKSARNKVIENIKNLLNN